MSNGHKVLATRYTHLTYKDPEDPTSRLVKRTRYNKGDVIPDGVLTEENLQRLLAAGAIEPVGADEESLVPQIEPDEDPTDDGVKGVRTLENPDSPGGLAGAKEAAENPHVALTPDEVPETTKNPEAEGAATSTDKEVGDYESWDYAKITAEAEKRGVTGPDGSKKKKDLVAALKADDES